MTNVLEPPILNVIALLLVAVWATAVLYDVFSPSYDDAASVSVACGVMLGSLFTFAAAVHEKDKRDD